MSNQRALLGRFFDSVNDSSWGMPDAYEPRAVARAIKRLSRFYGPGKYFNVESSGWERVPPAPCLFVANHSGGTSIPDAWGLGWEYHQQFGFTRPIHMLAHDMVFALRLTARPFSKLGIVRARREIAMSVLTEYKRDMMVMPGGDIETWRPYRDRYTLRWSGRKGYAKMALKANVPIVPIACSGAHSTLYVLTDGQRFAKWIGLHRFARSSVFPIHFSFPWGLAIGPWPHIPPPATFHYRVGDPIYPPAEIVLGDEPSQSAIDETDRQVRHRMQLLLDQLRATEARR